MSYYCCYPICDNTYRKRPSKSFFHFPRDESRAKEWLAMMEMKEIPKSRNSAPVRVCSDHFLETDFDKTSAKRLLLTTAVPEKLKKCTSVSRFLKKCL